MLRSLKPLKRLRASPPFSPRRWSLKPLKRLGEKGGEALQAVCEEDRDVLKDTLRGLHYENWTK